jgi:transposase
LKYSIQEIKRPIRRRLQRIVEKEKDGDYRRRAMAILILNEGDSLSPLSRTLSASRTSIRTSRVRFIQFGEVGLVPERQGRSAETVTDILCTRLLELLDTHPGDYGYLGSRLTSEMLTEQLYELWSLEIHSSTVRRLLPKLGL